MKIVTIIGARPQFIKAAAVSRKIAERENIQEVLVHTGQHYDANMSDIFFEELSIPRPHYHLGIGGGHHGEMTGRMLGAIESVLLDEKPDWVLVYGDTNSTLAGALAAVKLHIPVAHIEAGLRSFNRRMPEEINRVLTDHASDLLLAPTRIAMSNLSTEGVAQKKCHLVGDVMYDASLFYRDRARKPIWFAELGIAPSEFVLATIHRAENTDDLVRLAGIMQGLGSAGLPVILPLHPRTRGKLREYGITLSANLHAVEPVGYLEMIWLEANCALVATDSGGVQKEAYFFQKPCVTLRNETEWVELVETGWNVLAGVDAEKIGEAISTARVTDDWMPIYGLGDASSKIFKVL